MKIEIGQRWKYDDSIEKGSVNIFIVEVIKLLNQSDQIVIIKQIIKSNLFYVGQQLTERRNREECYTYLPNQDVA